MEQIKKCLVGFVYAIWLGVSCFGFPLFYLIKEPNKPIWAIIICILCLIPLPFLPIISKKVENYIFNTKN